MRFVAPAVLVLLVGLSGPIFALATAPPTEGEIMLVVGPDAERLEAIVTRAGGRVIGPELARFGAFALAESDGFSSSLRAQGAWAVLDGRVLARFCGLEV